MSAPRESLKHPLADYLAASGESQSAFAARAGAGPDIVASVLDQSGAADLGTARRILAASSGAIELADLVGPAATVVLDGRFGTGPRINDSLLAAVLEVIAPKSYRLDSEDAAFAAGVAADIYDALSAVSALTRTDRLAEALRPALRESFAKTADRGDPDAAARQAARLYLAAEARLSA